MQEVTTKLGQLPCRLKAFGKADKKAKVEAVLLPVLPPKVYRRPGPPAVVELIKKDLREAALRQVYAGVTGPSLWPPTQLPFWLGPALGHLGVLRVAQEEFRRKAEGVAGVRYPPFQQGGRFPQLLGKEPRHTVSQLPL